MFSSVNILFYAQQFLKGNGATPAMGLSGIVVNLFSKLKLEPVCGKSRAQIGIGGLSGRIARQTERFAGESGREPRTTPVTSLPVRFDHYAEGRKTSANQHRLSPRRLAPREPRGFVADAGAAPAIGCAGCLGGMTGETKRPRCNP
jgi:hypothetical protein